MKTLTTPLAAALSAMALIPLPAFAQAAQAGPGELVADLEGDGEFVTLDGRESVLPALIAQYNWYEDIGLGPQFIGSGPVLEHFFDLGDYAVTLEVVGIGGATSTWTMPITVREPLLVPDQFATLQDAVNAATFGDSIVLAPGVYTGLGFTDVFIDENIHVRGAGNDPTAVVIDLASNGRAFTVASVVPLTMISNLTIRNGFADGLIAPSENGGAIWNVDSTLRVANCIFEDNEAVAGGAIFSEAAQLRCYNCVFRGNTATADGAAIGATGPFGTRIYSGTFAQNTSPGSAVTAIPDSLGVSALVSVFSSILWDNGPTPVAPAVLEVSDTLIEGGWTGFGAGNIDVDPLFQDPTNGNLRLSILSPAVDAATGQLVHYRGARDLNGVEAYDLAGIGTGTGTVPHFDLGAFEYVPASDIDVVVAPGRVEVLSEVVQLEARAEYQGVPLPYLVIDSWSSARGSITSSGLYTAPADQLSGLDVTASFTNPFVGGASGTGALVPYFFRGDVNLDGAPDMADVIFLLDLLFTPGAPPFPLYDSADANDDGNVDISDSVRILNALFQGGAPLAEPEYTGPGSQKGPDPTPDALP